MSHIVSTEAYAKIMLHALKFPARPVFGIVLGREEGKNLYVCDAIPLFHNYPLAPMLEISMMQVLTASSALLSLHLSYIYCFQVESFCKLQRAQPLKILGSYCGHELSDSKEIPPQAIKLSSKIYDSFEDAILFAVSCCFPCVRSCAHFGSSAD